MYVHTFTAPSKAQPTDREGRTQTMGVVSRPRLGGWNPRDFFATQYSRDTWAPGHSPDINVGITLPAASPKRSSQPRHYPRANHMPGCRPGDERWVMAGS